MNLFAVSRHLHGLLEVWRTQRSRKPHHNRGFHYDNAHALLDHVSLCILPPFDAREWNKVSAGFGTVAKIGDMHPTAAAVAARQGKPMIYSSEAFSTKMCSLCFTVNNFVGSSKTFRCPCGLVTRRDLGNA
jgi:hypothetical protein